MADDDAAPMITGRCYCGATTIHATAMPQTISYCHCSDCRRVTSAPVAAFAGFDEAAFTISPGQERQVRVTPGVTRTFCRACGSPLTGRYDYLPGVVYIGLGLLDQAGRLAPTLHSHDDNRLTWLHINDDLVRHAGTAKSKLVP